jgi:hypothetical protein
MRYYYLSADEGHGGIASGSDYSSPSRCAIDDGARPRGARVLGRRWRQLCDLNWILLHISDLG